jgi:hypothetical protein
MADITADQGACAFKLVQEQELLTKMEEEHKDLSRRLADQKRRVEAAAAALREATLRAAAEEQRRAVVVLPPNSEGFGASWDGGFRPELPQWRKAVVYKATALSNEDQFEREIARTATKNSEQPRTIRRVLLAQADQAVPFSQLEEAYGGHVDNIRWWLNKMANKNFVRIVVAA